MVNLERADAVANDAHRGQTRRHGTPYIDHPRAVRRIAEALGAASNLTLTDSARAAALLHDVVEDSPTTVAELASQFGDDVAKRVELLTKTESDPAGVARYYAKLRAEGDVLTRLIKVSDRCHNLSELHRSKAGAPDRTRLQKYVDETREHVVPLTFDSPALAAALQNAVAAAERAQPLQTVAPARRLPSGIYAVLEPDASLDAFQRRVHTLCQAGSALVQVRDKRGSDRATLAALRAALDVTRVYGVPLLANDRPDLAVIAGVDGVHVGQTDVPAADARRLLGASALIGTSTHNAAQAANASSDDANDYVAMGPVFLSPTKQGHAPVLSPQELATMIRSCRKPVCAIGGVVDAARVVDVARAGASLVAVVSAVSGPDLDAVALQTRVMSLCFAAARATWSAA